MSVIGAVQCRDVNYRRNRWRAWGGAVQLRVMPWLRFLFLTVLIALGSTGAARAGAPADYLAPDSEARWVAFDLTDSNQIRFRTLLNGHWVDAMLDTGVSDTAMSARLARKLGMKPLVRGRADAIGGSVLLAWTALERVEVGGLVRLGGRIAIIDADPRVTGTAPIDLFIGADLLGKHALDIDFAARRFRLMPSGRMPFRGSIAPLRLDPVNGLYLTELRLGERQERQIIVDSGDGSMMTLALPAWRGNEHLGGPVTTAMAWGLGGPVTTELTILPELRIASLVTETVELRIEGEGGFSARKGAGGRIGNGLLRRHRVLLDPGARRMVLAPLPGATWPVTRSTSGLMVTQDGDRLRVLHVMRSSPAAQSGWRAGAEICAIDGAAIPADYANSDAAGWSVGAPGRRVKLTLCDGAERELALARFY